MYKRKWSILSEVVWVTFKINSWIILPGGKKNYLTECILDGHCKPGWCFQGNRWSVPKRMRCGKRWGILLIKMTHVIVSNEIFFLSDVILGFDQSQKRSKWSFGIKNLIHTSPPSLASLPSPNPIPSGCHRVLDWAPCAGCFVLLYGKSQHNSVKKLFNLNKKIKQKEPKIFRRTLGWGVYFSN